MCSRTSVLQTPWDQGLKVRRLGGRAIYRVGPSGISNRPLRWALGALEHYVSSGTVFCSALVVKTSLRYTFRCASGKGKGAFLMHWYNPKTRSVEDTSAPFTDEEATDHLRGNISSEAFLTVYDRLRAEGMAIEQALIFVGHHFRLRHLEYRPSR